MTQSKKVNSKKESVESPLEKHILELESQLALAQESQSRSLADLENFRRREAAAKIAWTNTAVSQFLKNVLPSFLELSLGSEHSQDEALKKVIEKFFSELKTQGLEKISPKDGEPINLELHEVLLMEEGPPGCIVKCLEPGWKYKENVIVPAKVSGAST